MTERNKDGPFHSAAPCELQFQKAKKKKKKGINSFLIEVIMILHINIWNPSKFRSDDSIIKINIKYILPYLKD